MKAALFSEFHGSIDVVDVPEPAPPSDGVVVRVEATGLCRSDWHGWMGHDPDIALPHVPGHELAGTVVEVGADVSTWQVGDRVTVPFVAGCGRCEACLKGDEQVCAYQYQPGFTAWGSFAEYVVLRYADRNLVQIPEQIDSATAALLGCRFATAYRGVVAQGRAEAGQWVAVHGCGGAGLAAIMIAQTLGARTVAIDPEADARAHAKSLGADAAFDPSDEASLVDSIREATGGGPHLSIDAAGHPVAAASSVASLRSRGRHVQIGLLPDNYTSIPMGTVIGRELEIFGSHGMQAHRYPKMMEMILDGRLNPRQLITRVITLSDIPEALAGMGRHREAGATVVVGMDR